MLMAIGQTLSRRHQRDLMLPWMRDQIAEAWHSRKNSRASADRRAGSNNNTDKSVTGGSSEGSGSRDETGMFLPAAASSETFSVNVISLEGGVLGVTVKPSFTIERIKNIATRHFYGQQDTRQSASSSATTSSRYRLVHCTGHRQLFDDRIISDEDVKAFDELILMEIRPAPTRENLTEKALRGPNQEAIDHATTDLPIRNPTRPVPSNNCSTDFQAEFRKILITLVQASAKILMHSDDAGKVYEVIRDKLELRCKPPSDPKIVKNLVDMGFSEKKVLKALHLRKMNTSEALEWLIEHQDDPDDEDIELPALDEPEVIGNEENSTSGPSWSSGAFGGTKRRSLKEACADLFKGGQRSETKKEPNLVKVVGLLLDSFRQYKRLEFKPSLRVKQSLIEMGFEEKQVVEALKVTGNDQSNACEWLLGQRRLSLQDLDDGLDPEGPIYKAIMNNAHVQLSLTNPKMLLAYLSILETPSSANVWINDPEVSPVLSQIFKTYHSEKHAIHMNRYENS